MLTHDTTFSIARKLTTHEQRLISDEISSIVQLYTRLSTRLVQYSIPRIIIHENGMLENQYPPNIQRQLDQLTHHMHDEIESLLRTKGL